MPGVGLGLAICDAIVEAHRGRIWAENRAPHGARFVFTLPLDGNRPWSRKREVTNRREEGTIDTARQHPRSSRTRHEIRRFVRQALEAEGCRVFEAENLQRGLIEAGTRKPDLVILDLGLPDGDGVDFIREVRGWSGAADRGAVGAQSRSRTRSRRSTPAPTTTSPSPSAWASCWRGCASRCAGAPRAGERAGPWYASATWPSISRNRRVAKGEQEVHLTPIEYRLLADPARPSRQGADPSAICCARSGDRRTSSTATTCASTWATAAQTRR